MRAPADPLPQTSLSTAAKRPAIPGAPVIPHAHTPSTADHDASYRDLLLRVREEREQLGQLISHPF